MYFILSVYYIKYHVFHTVCHCILCYLSLLLLAGFITVRYIYLVMNGRYRNIYYYYNFYYDIIFNRTHNSQQFDVVLFLGTRKMGK